MSQVIKKRSNHIDSIEPKIPSHTNRQPSKSRTVYSGSISDLEKDDCDYHKISKKLTKDKSELKDKLRRLIDEIENKTKEHRVEMEKTQAYFQDQIDELIEEKERLTSELEQSRNSAIKDREKNMKELNKHKEMMEQCYSTRDTQTIKHLENTIATLQDRLNQQSDEREHIKKTAEQLFAQKEEILQKNISDLEEQLRKSREQSMMDRRELQTINKTFADEKEQLLLRFNREKDEEIAKIILERDTITGSLRVLKEQFEKRTRTLDQQRDEEIARARFELERKQSEYDRKVTDVISTCRKNIDDIKQEYDGKMLEQNRQFQINMETKLKENEKIIQTINYENAQKIDQLGDQLQKIKEMRDKELYEIRLQHEKSVGEMADENQKLKEHIIQHQETVKKMQESIQQINTQCVDTVNKQKELADKEIANKDAVIVQLERKSKKALEEILDKTSSVERKNKNLAEDIKEITDKYHNLKTNFEKSEQAIQAQRTQIYQQKDVNEKLVDQIKQLQKERDTYEKKMQNVDMDYKTYDQELAKYKLELSKVIHMEAKYKEDISQLNETISKLKTDFEEKTRAYNIDQDKMNKLAYLAQDAQAKVVEYETELKKKQKQLITLQQDLETANKNSMISSAETTAMCTKLSDEFKQKLSQLNEEKGQENNELTKRIGKFEQTVRNKDIQIQALISQMDVMQNNFRQTIDKLTSEQKKDKDELSEMRSKTNVVEDQSAEIDRLKGVITTMHNNFQQSVKKMEDEHKTEVTKLRKKLDSAELAVTQTDKKIELLKLNFLKELNEAKRLPPEDQEKMNKLQKENEELNIQLISAEKKLQQLQFDFATASATIKTKTEILSEREADIKRAENELKHAPPKLLDPSIKKARDEALTNLRQSKIELGKVKEESLQLSQKLQVAESLVKELEKEKQMIIRAQSDLKETFVNNLNQQHQNHEKEILQKNDRIRELEDILMTKMKA